MTAFGTPDNDKHRASLHPTSSGILLAHTGIVRFGLSWLQFVGMMQNSLDQRLPQQWKKAAGLWLKLKGGLDSGPKIAETIRSGSIPTLIQYRDQGLRKGPRAQCIQILCEMG